jgi:hypothetical protein
MESSVLKYRFVDKGMVETNRGVAWSGEVWQDVAPYFVCKVSNAGEGGCNSYDWSDFVVWDGFVVRARELYQDGFEPVDAFVDELWADSVVAGNPELEKVLGLLNEF